MDSLTQIVLGAACGEAVLGKKIGNRAILFGGIAGTVPDLDVLIGNLIFSNEIDDLAFHRGIMHSIFFAIVGSIALGWFTFKLYDTAKRKGSSNRSDWIRLFFLAMFTHPILDSFTQYGTQLFLPFSNYRVAFNTISVVDPLYTLPFLICLVVVMFIKRTSNIRRTWLKVGIGISSFYLLLTIINHIYVKNVFEYSIENESLEISRLRIQPTFGNNILWYGIAEGQDYYYSGMYSIFDSEAKILKWKKLSKNHTLMDMQNERAKTLIWFSDGFFNIHREDSTDNLIYYDLRYPSLDPDKPETSVFNFKLIEKEGTYDIEQNFDSNITEEQFAKFLKRIKGI